MVYFQQNSQGLKSIALQEVFYISRSETLLSLKVFTLGCPYTHIYFSIVLPESVTHLKIQETGQQNFKSKPDLENRHQYNTLQGYTAKAFVTL